MKLSKLRPLDSIWIVTFLVIAAGFAYAGIYDAALFFVAIVVGGVVMVSRSRVRRPGTWGYGGGGGW